MIQWRNFGLALVLASFCCLGSESGAVAGSSPTILEPEKFKWYIDSFNGQDSELYRQFIPNESAWSFLSRNIPLFECSDKTIEEIYYFRWWTYRKHIEQTPDGFIITEFLPKVPWAGKYNSINCAAGHHLYEGRWLRDPTFLDDYGAFWFRKGGAPRRYSFWAADALYARYLVTGDKGQILELLPDLIRNYETWEGARSDSNGLLWQEDSLDGMEVSIGGSGYRPTISSYMYGDAMAIARTAELAGRPEVQQEFLAKAGRLKELVQSKLWNSAADFFETRRRGKGEPFVDVRELHGYTPWYFSLPDPPYAIAWKQLVDPRGFYASFGPTTAERRHPAFAISYQGHECQWNGPSWPYATAVTLTALANLLNQHQQDFVTRQDYFDLIKIYAASQHRQRENGSSTPWIDENLNPLTGDWLSRTRLKSWKNGTWDSGKGGIERGKDYNHSTFCDLIISGLIGLRPRPDDFIEVNPLVPEGAWDYFCLDNIGYHHHLITIFFDRTGRRYGRGPGLRLLADGKQIGSAEKIGRITAAEDSILHKLIWNRITPSERQLADAVGHST